MKVFINAISIVEGGGLIVLKNLLEEMNRVAPQVLWYVAATPNTLSKLAISNEIIALPYPWANRSPLHLFFWYEMILPKLVRQINADIFFSQTNFLPRRKLSCPSLLLIQHAGYFSEKFKQLYFYWYRKPTVSFLWKQKIKWVYGSIKRASTITVQTEALARKISKQLNFPKEKIFVVSHGAGFLNTSTQKQRNFPTDFIWRVGYITKFGVQKNFDTAFKAIKILNNRGVSVKLILTLNENTVEFSTIYRKFFQYGIEEHIENHGEISDPGKLKILYESLHIFVFPSLCESFGFTLVEAMAFGLPLIVADTDSNREVAGAAGEMFSPENEQELADKIYKLINDRELYTSASKNSIEKSHEFCWNKAAKNILHIINKMLNDRRLTK